MPVSCGVKLLSSAAATTQMPGQERQASAELSMRMSVEVCCWRDRRWRAGSDGDRRWWGRAGECQRAARSPAGGLTVCQFVKRLPNFDRGTKVQRTSTQGRPERICSS